MSSPSANPTPEMNLGAHEANEAAHFGRLSQIVFLYAGLFFLLVALSLFGLGSWSLFTITRQGPVIVVPESSESVNAPSGAPAPTPSSTLTERDRYNFYGRILSFCLGPVLMFGSAAVCTFVGIKLLRSAGAVRAHVIPPEDLALLFPAIRAGDTKAISEYIRLSSLSGVTGTFTKVGLTGLPLATITLTVVLAAFGLFVPKLLDLAQLTLGAFIGSYVQKKQEPSLPA